MATMNKLCDCDENLPEVFFGVHLHSAIVTYPLDKVMRPLNNWGKKFKQMITG